MIEKIISGGQIGADLAALIAGKMLNIPTGGWMPKGFKTKKGNKPNYLEEFGVQEHTSSKYSPRTYSNVRDSDATIRFANNFNSAGEICTLKAINYYNKPYMDILVSNPPSHKEVADWIVQNNIKTLNVAGNADEDIEEFVCNYLIKTINLIKD